MTLSTSALSVIKKLAATREALVAENAIKAESLGAYRASMRDVPYADQITFEEWLAKQPPKEAGYAEGGSVDKDQIQATPESNPAMAALARMLSKADAFARKPFGYNNPPAQIISDLLGVPALQKTAERAGYGEPLTSGRGWTSRMHPETEEALLAAPQFASPLGKMAQLTKGLPVGASIKPKGGNWLSGSVEDALGGLKRHKNPDEMLKLYKTSVSNPETTAETLAELNRRLPEWQKESALNAWIDKQLTRYVKNDMATPEDPIRELAERGVLHVDPSSLAGRSRTVHPSGEVIQKLGKSEQALGWENASDRLIAPEQARNFLSSKNAAGSLTVERNPWLAKVPPDTPVYDLYGGAFGSNLGFDHLMDELRNATNPASGLPLDLQLKYSSLNQVSVPQAVERVARINEWRAAQKVEADMAKANNAATVLHKEYPENNPKGFKWVELKQPDRPTIVEGEYKDPMFDIPPAQQERIAQQAHQQARRIYPDDESDEYMMAVQDIQGELSNAYGAKNKPVVSKELQDALEYEGDTMGHCVGGYCDGVMEGRSRIFSLRSAKGEPHVTIEVAPGNANLGVVQMDPKYQAFAKTLAGKSNGEKEAALKVFFDENPIPDRIVQIKGKANRAPNPEYLPYVQDFVKSGKWSDVGDLQNTGLIKHPETGEWVTQGSRRQEVLDEMARDAQPPEPGFAHGGSVTADYDSLYLDHRVNQLRTELGL